MLAWIPLFPLLGFLVNGAWYAFGQAPRGKEKAGALIPGLIASFSIFASFLVSLVLFLKLQGLEPEQRIINQSLYNWFSVANLHVEMAFRLDALSAIFSVFITGVATLIHIYSIGYMSHDATPGKYFAYLNLFCFSMLMLILGASLPILFLGWEGVGLCSYLLIGYWYADTLKASAGKKAFVVNRIGDLGFLLGMFLIFYSFGSLDFEAVRSIVVGTAHGEGTIHGVGQGTITVICTLLFIGCMGKSAQIPLYVWLPDAMAGPTPVSALIHAATMVTSGIYLVSRLNFLYSLSPTAMSIVAITGAVTAFFAATIAIAQTDIKKVLAYSTVSQLGYMFLACGVGAYTAGVFHVITHAFFKALLFLGAGSVIHGMHDEQDILKMGGLKSKMPKTWLTFTVGLLAICGLPPFSGFFSKDEILWQAFSSPSGSVILWLLGAVTAVMTAFYMTRLYSLTFLGTPRFSENRPHTGAKVIPHQSHSFPHDGHGHGQSHESGGVHESPSLMIIPLQVLAVLSFAGGLIGIPHFSWLDHWLETVIPTHHAVSSGTAPAMEWVLMGVSIFGAAVGMIFALKLYSNLDLVSHLKTRFAPIHKLLENKWYVDEIFNFLFIRPIYQLSLALWKGFDVAVIDRLALSLGWMSERTGQTVRVIQTGSLHVYAIMTLLGLIMTVGYLMYGMA